MAACTVSIIYSLLCYGSIDDCSIVKRRDKSNKSPESKQWPQIGLNDLISFLREGKGSKLLDKITHSIITLGLGQIEN